MGDILPPGFYNMDCMEAMRQFPDGFFDLAIVDPPYGDGNAKIGGVRFGGWFDRYKRGTDSDSGSTGTSMESIPRRNNLLKIYGGVQSSEPGTHGAKNTAKKLLRGTWPRNNPILTSCFASHAIRSFGAGTISNCRRQGAFWCGKNLQSPKVFQWRWQSTLGQVLPGMPRCLKQSRKGSRKNGFTRHKSPSAFTNGF